MVPHFAQWIDSVPAFVHVAGMSTVYDEFQSCSTVSPLLADSVPACADITAEPAAAAVTVPVPETPAIAVFEEDQLMSGKIRPEKFPYFPYALNTAELPSLSGLVPETASDTSLSGTSII